MPNQVKFCPNCGSDATELKGNRLLCTVCNITYKIEENGSAKIVDMDPLGKITDKIMADVDKKIDEKLAGKQAGPADGPPVDDPDEFSDGFFE